MKILHLAPDYPNSKLYPHLISSLEGIGCDNCVYVQSCGVETANPYPVHYLGRDFGIMDRLLYFRKQHIIENNIFERGLLKGVDLVHAHNLFSTGYNAYRFRKKFHIPYIVAVRNTDVNVFFKYMFHLRFIGVRIMHDAASVVFLSPSYRDEVLNNYVPPHERRYILQKSHVIPNGLDPFFMEHRATVPRQMVDYNRIKIIYVGDIDKNKNISTTIKACKILKNRGYQVSLDVVGRIKDKKQDYIKSVDFVNYHPFSPKEDVLEYMKKSDIFVMPSIHETFGLVYIEAMSQGLPVIYSKGQGLDGYFEEGKIGYHVSCFDEHAVADSIMRIMDNYTPMSNNCIAAVKSFSWKEKAEEYKKLYINTK